MRMTVNTMITQCREHEELAFLKRANIGYFDKLLKGDIDPVNIATGQNRHGWILRYCPRSWWQPLPSDAAL